MKIVITELIWPIGIELLEKRNDLVVYDPELWKDGNRLAYELKDADALIVRNQTQVNEKLLQLGTRLKVIGRLGVGLDNIDLKSAGDRNIPVVIGKNANATSVAEYVISALFTFCRLLDNASKDVKDGHWNRKKFTGNEIYGKTMGLIGIGEIGHRVAMRAKTLGLRVLGYDPYIAPYDFPVMETGIQWVTFDQVLENSDFISLHVPLTGQTRNLINKEALGAMKPTSVIINTSRGGIINEDDLCDALRNQMISGAVLDVLEQEPPRQDHPLLQMDNCIITPHIAGLTEESQLRTSEMVVKEVIGELQGQASLCRVALRK
jgi:D-3-phosphoglycerate dehydrogenase